MNSLPDIRVCKENEIRILERDLHSHVKCSIIHRSQDTRISLVSSYRCTVGKCDIYKQDIYVTKKEILHLGKCRCTLKELC